VPRSLHLALALTLLVVGGAGATRADDPPVKPDPAKDAKPAASPPSAASAEKVELLYRWDLLDGKIAVYDVELVSHQSTERKTESALSAEDEDPKTEARTTTKMRLSFAFARGERERGRVTVSSERLLVSVAQTALGKTETLTYDSSNPGKSSVPEQLKALVNSLLGAPYTLVVSRRGVVESVEGRPRSELDSLKGTFLVLPEMPLAAGEGWTRISPKNLDPIGTSVTTIAYKLARATEPATGVPSNKPQGERRIELKVKMELDDRLGRVPARIEGATGSGHIVFDVRGLKVEEDSTAGYELIVKQEAPPVEQHNRIESTSHWKLVELKDAEPK
jgi:hypothetical protein